MKKRDKLDEALHNIPRGIKNTAKENTEIRVVILNELHRRTNISKAEIFDYMNRHTKYKLEREDVK